MPEVGELAPDFIARDTQGVERTLASLTAQGPVVLVFFPRAFTPVCTRELGDYRAQYAGLRAKNVEVLAVSADDDATQHAFKTSLKAPFPFIADRRLVELFGVRTPLLGWAMRTTFLIGRDRRVLGIWQGAEAAEPTSVVDMLMAEPKETRHVEAR